jgi:hypothetical protein
MWHVAPIVRPIGRSCRKLRAIENESIGTCPIQNLTQIIDPALLWRMPLQVYCSILCRCHRAKHKREYISHIDVPTKRLGKRVGGAEQEEGAESYGAHMVHGLYCSHRETMWASITQAEGCSWKSVRKKNMWGRGLHASRFEVVIGQLGGEWGHLVETGCRNSDVLCLQLSWPTTSWESRQVSRISRISPLLLVSGSRCTIGLIHWRQPTYYGLQGYSHAKTVDRSFWNLLDVETIKLC